MPVIRRKTQKGSALIYILVAIALLAALTATFMDSSGTQTSSQRTFDIVTEFNSEINYIRSAIQECVLTYPSGDSTMPANPVGGENVNRPFPLNPVNTYLASPAASVLAANIRCPGNPGNSNDHAKIFDGNRGKFFPAQNPLFTNWVYYNNTDGIFITKCSFKTDAFISTALEKLDEQFEECSADVVDATSGVVALNSPGAGNYNASSGSKCFRVWIMANPSNVYLGDTNGDEVACP